MNRLEEKNFIVRRTNPADRRYRVVELTEKGEQMQELLEKLEEAVDSLTDAASNIEDALEVM